MRYKLYRDFEDTQSAEYKIVGSNFTSEWFSIDGIEHSRLRFLWWGADLVLNGIMREVRRIVILETLQFDIGGTSGLNCNNFWGEYINSTIQPTTIKSDNNFIDYSIDD